MSTLIIGNAILFICALLTAGRSYRVGSEQYTSGFTISLSATFLAASAVASMLLTGSQDQDHQTLLRMLNNLAYYAAVPLIASAMVADAIGQNWSKPAWGRWLLVLLALFEVTRRGEAGLEYSQIMSVLVAASMLFAAVKLQSLMARLGSLVAAISIAAAALLFSPISLMPEYQSALLYPAALGLMVFASSLVLPAHKADA